MIFIPNREKIILVLEQQLSLFWKGLFNRTLLECAIEPALEKMENNLYKSNVTRFRNKKDCIFSVYDTTQWSIFLYYLSKILCEMEFISEANVVYYLNKIMHSVDWYYEIKLPDHFMVEHPVGSVLGKAQYGDYFMIYQGVTVGGNRKANIIEYPQLGNNILLYANSSVIGNTIIGNNVIISTGSILINEIIPSNSIVFGSTPNVQIKEKTEKDIKERTKHIWRWME